MKEVPANVLRQFGLAVKKLRLEKRMTQQELADKCGLDIGYIGQVERGQRNLSLGVIHNIAAVLHVKVVDLMRSAKL